MKYILPILISIALLASCSNSKKTDGNTSVQKDTIKEPVKVYGFILDSFDIEHDEVKRNMNLSDILNEVGVSASNIYKLAQLTDSVFDVRRFRSGNTYALFYKQGDTTNALQYFVYEIDEVEFLVMDVRNANNFNVYKDKKEVKIVEKSGSGVIESSLWNAMAGNNLPTMLSLELSDMYAWTVDFFGLQKGDAFKVVYEEQFVDSTSIGVKSIKYAMFTHMGEDIYAIPFEQDSIVAFFDSVGNSLRKAFLKAPLKYSRISSGFSHARRHPVLKIVRPHHGVDYAAPAGTPVMSIGDGTVIKKGYSGGAGHMVKIKHNSTYTTAYLHLSRYGDIKVGSRVAQGQIIGYVGSTGLSTGPHLDFRVYKHGSAINPLKLESPPVAPVKQEDIARFNVVRDSLITQLNKISF